MITTAQFIETHRDTACRADWLNSLAQAANLVLEGNALTDKDKRRAIVLDVLSAISFLSADLSTATVRMTDKAEGEAIAEKRELEKLIETALKEDKLLPSQENWAREVGKRNIEALQAYLGHTPQGLSGWVCRCAVAQEGGAV